MKYSLDWLGELAGTKKTVEQLAELVGLKGFEFEGSEKMKVRYTFFCVGKIVEIKPHPNADRLQVTKVEVGKKSLLQIVCGAKNIQVGDWVPVAQLGAIVPKNGMKIEAAKLRGVKSQGMLCAEDELLLGKSHEGILILERAGKQNSLVATKRLQAGMDLAIALDLDDEMIEFSILPNRAHDCLGHLGLAREICAMEGRCLKTENSKLKFITKPSDLLSIRLKDKERCSRYIGAVLENVKVRPAPAWMQKRLLAAGMEPINNVVDITNYVMLEVGNPLHAFDFEQVKSPKAEKENVNIVIRRAKEGESLELLDGSKIKLDENDLVIANEEKALALAGIKGGKEAGISDQTDKIVLEVANFNAFWIRKTRQKHALATESQARFEKELSATLAEQAAMRAIELLEKYAGAKLIEVKEESFSQEKSQSLSFDFTQAEKLLGQKISRAQGKKILENLGFEIKADGKDKLKVTVPAWRLDIESAHDLVEEIGRIIGYEKVAPKAMLTPVQAPQENESRTLEWKIKSLMTAQGFDELRNYSFYSERDAKVFSLNKEDHWQIIAPGSEELALMRLSLWPMMLRKTGENERYFEEFQLFELARIYQKNQADEPEEKLKLAATFFNQNLSAEELFFELKGATENLLNGLAINDPVFAETEKIGNLFQAGQEAAIKSGSKILGKIGMANHRLTKYYHIKKSVAILELDFEALFALTNKREKIYQPLPKFPLVLRDISLFAPEFKTAREVEETIQQAAGQSLKQVELFDVFLNQKIKQKSLAFHLSFGSDNRTMTGEEVDELMVQVVQKLETAGLKVRIE